MSATFLRTIKNEKLHRSYELQSSTLDKEKRTVRARFSSESPVKRSFKVDGKSMLANEVLDHSPESCDMGRLMEGTAVLLEHDINKRIGITDGAELNADRTIDVILRFARTELGNSAMAEVEDGTLRYVSAGYEIEDASLEESRNEGELPTVRAMKWRALEATLTGIPADRSCRVYRSGESTSEIEFSQKKVTRNMDSITPAPVAPAPAPAAPAIVRSEAEIQAVERSRAKEIWAIANTFKRTGAEASDAVINGTTIDGYRALVLDSMKGGSTTEPVTASGDRSQSGKTPGDLFIESEGYRSMVDNFKRSGRMPQGVRLSHDVPYVQAPYGSRATLTTSGLTSIEKESGVVLLEQRPLLISGIIPSVPTDAVTVRYTQETAYTNASTDLAEEGEYQEATFSLDEVDATVRKIGVLGKITDEQLADYDYTRDYVNNRIRFMVDERVDNMLLTGTGVSVQIKGLLSFSGIQTQALAADTVPDAIHKAITKVRTVGFFEPDHIVLHPNDWQDIRLMKDNEGRYYGGGPFSTLPPMLWGLPVVQTTAITEGTGLVGAFRMGCAQRPKSGLSVETSNSNGDDFKYGRISVRADRRLTLCCYRPLAFCKVTGIA